MENGQTIPTLWERSRLLVKGFFIGFLILLMLIPGVFISNLVNERSQRRDEVIAEITSKWAGEQNIMGPVLMLPYKEYVTDKDGKVLEYRKEAFFLPDKLSVTGTMVPEERHRSIFSVTLYRSALKIDGQFNAPALAALNIKPELVLWNEAHLIMSTSDLRGLEDDASITWNGTKKTMEFGVPDNAMFKNGLNSAVTITDSAPATFSIVMNIKGSDHLYITPVGKTTNVTLSAPWKDPAFDGQYLPNQSDVSQNGFTAKWKVSPLPGEFPRQWIGSTTAELYKSAFGVKLLQPVDGYAKTQRSVKYAMLFVSLTFIFFFFLEVRQRKQVHPLQYVLVGLALSIFYTLLLSISEYAGFNLAYLIASTAIVGLISTYAWSIFDFKTAVAFAFVLTGLYVYIFVLIQSQDYALLLGSIGLFVIMAVVMYYSRKINWYHTSEDKVINP